MLNPFAIEKDLLQKTAAVKLMLRSVKAAVAAAVVAKKAAGV
jgi:hypothetical protein